MYLKIDFDSEEALYIQLRNQIIIGIAKGEYSEGILCLLSDSWRKKWESTCIR